MNTMKVLVYDDDPKIADRLASNVLAVCNNAHVTAVEGEVFRNTIRQINDRRTAWRSGSNEDSPIELTNADDADIVVVDYDLLSYFSGGDITGSRVAYLFRCFTRCGLIVVLNEYGINVFDMNLRRRSLDFTDLHLGAIQIGNPGLWTGSFEGYRPWHWPILPDAAVNFEKCVQDVLENQDQPILDFFGLISFVDWMPKEVYDIFLGVEEMDVGRFGTFLRHPRGGIEPKDELPIEFSARVTAARLLTILNGLILPEQSLLVDAPHLVSRFPSLLRGDGENIHYWNQLCDPLNENIDRLLESCLMEHRFKRQHWLWQPVWYWPDIAKDERITEVRDPWTITDVPWVFCEDTSRFVDVGLTDSFRADVAPPFDRRFVLARNLPEDSIPVGKVGSGEPQDPLTVEYVPQVAFSM